ncbi:MAG TPA: hypothetical protein VJ976_10005 [Ornithinimicrobium sp.]|uniref:hypothetical protein n=1 Tax=Ornithinimicrobium sp. TaxID=1977084 RepID=UPI002B48DC89|nr:hypothetical protein [Ornithinimicrobium sp.]HKJ12703.1 hypothetical protein [Ornithinimicrobium sp.]
MRPAVLVVATARPTFAVEVARERAEQARALLQELGADVTGPPGLVMSEDDLQAARAVIDADGGVESYDLVVHVCASFSDASPALALYAGLPSPVVLWAMREPGPVGDRLWLNSLCGANLFGHAIIREGGRVRLVYGDPGDAGVEESLGAALRGEPSLVATLEPARGERAAEDTVRAALRSLDGRSVGLVSDAPTGFTPSEFDPDLLSELFGITTRRWELPDLFDRVDAVDPTERDAELREAREQRPGLDGLDDAEVSRHAEVTVALREWEADAELAALAVRCWPEIPTERGVCPCSSLSRIADGGTPTACERDVYGSVTMLLMQALGSGPTYLVDTVDLEAEANTIRVWHCGSAASVLAADPGQATQSTHCNRGIGVAGNFPLRTGRVVLARLTENVTPHGVDGLRLLITAGESVPAPNRFQGNTAEVRVDRDAAALVESLVLEGFPHHTVIAWNDVRPALRTAADILGIPVVEY